MSALRPATDLRRAITTGALLGALLLGAAGTLYARQSLTWERVHLASQVIDDTVYLPPATALRLSSLGYGPFWADMLFIRTHAYYLRHMYGDRIFKWLDPYVDAIITLDPDNGEVYYWASRVVRYGQIVDEAVVARSNRFAEKGIERFPDDARLYAHIGFNKYFELRSFCIERELQLGKRIDAITDLAEKDRLRREQAEIRKSRYDTERSALVDYTTAAMLPGGTVDPVFLVNLYIKQDLVEAAAHLAQTLYFDTPVEERRSLLARLETVGKKDEADKLRRMEEEYTGEMPFVPEGVFRLLARRSDLTVPERWDEVGAVYDEALRALESRERGEGRE